MNEKFTPKNLQKWIKSSDYVGDDLSEWYVLASQTRDSYLLERTNFSDIKAYLVKKGFEIAGDSEDCKADNAILLAYFGHWACGWYESIMIHQDNIKALQLGDEIKAALDDYPIFDEESYSEAEWDLEWDYVREYIVEDYMRDNDVDYDNTLLDNVTSKLLQTVDFEVNGYDEVHTSDDYDLESIIDYCKHLTQCPQCKQWIDNRSESCDCQMVLPL